MSKARALAVTLSLFIGLILANSAVCGDLRAVRADAVPVIDGDLNEPCWEAAPPCDAFTILHTDKPSPLKTEVRFAYDDYNLYIALKCHTPDVTSAEVRAPAVERDGRVLAYDSIEVMIDADRDGESYLHLATNSSGSLWDRRVVQHGWVGEDWDGEWRTASRVVSGFYTVEMAIPFYDLDIARNTTSTWKINVCRNVRTPGRSAYTSIAPRGAYNAPAQFPSLSGIEVDFERFMVTVGPVHTSLRFADKKTHVTISTELTNGAAAPNAVRVENWLIDPAGKPRVMTAGSHTLEPGRKQALSFGPYVVEESGTYQNWVVLFDAKTGRPLKIAKSPVNIECVPIALRIVEPFYRNTIFASQNLEKVKSEVEVGLEEAEMKTASLDLEVVSAQGGKPLLRQSRKGLGRVVRFEFPTAALPAEGRFLVRATLRDGAGGVLANTEQALLKLPHKEGEVWHGRDLIWRRDGEPIFPNGAWTGLPMELTPARNFRVYGTYPGRWLKVPPEPGKMKVWMIVAESSQVPPLRRRGPLSEEYLQDIRERVRFYRDDSDVLAWLLVDEPECSSIPADTLRQVYEVVREEDPYHPVWITCNSVNGVRIYADCADANVPHPYPPIRPDVRINDFSKLLHVQRAHVEATRGRKPVGFMHQGFNYGEFVLGSRMPSYYELRNQTVLALAAGATFLCGFEGSNANLWYPEVSIGLGRLAREMVFLGRLVVAPTSTRKVVCPDEDVVTLLKEDAAGHLHLFVSNASNVPRRLSVSVEGLGTRKLRVVSEGRSVESTEGVIADSFDIWQSHVYTTSTDDPGLKTVQEIIDEIEAEYARRRKPGNLAFQRWDGQSVDVSFSSRSGTYPPNPWHVCDGLTEPPQLQKSGTYAWLHVWRDATPNESPDWIALKFKQPHRINRIVVYTVGRCIRDYAIQARRGDDWLDVATGAAHTDDRIERAFEPVSTDQVRILVTATNGPHVTVSEIEVYGD